MRLFPLLLLGMLVVAFTEVNEAQAAFGTGGATCTANDKTAGTTTLQCTVATQNLDAGNIAVLWFAGDELATATTADHNNLLLTSVTDSGSNIWTVQRCFTNTQTTGAADGATTCIATSKLTTTLTSGSGTITATFAAITAKAMVVREFTVGAGNTIAVVGTPQDLANDGADPGSMTISGLANSEHLFIRSTALERANATWTVTAGHTLVTCNGTGGGGAATNMNICGEFRILTATADTSNPTATNVDNASIFIAFNEVPATTLSDGTDPGNTTLAPGAGATLAGEFRFQNSSGNDVISSVVVGLGTGAAAGLSKVEIIDTTSPTPLIYGEINNPGTDTPTIPLGGSFNTLTATTTLTTYRIRITPKTHPNMAPPATGVNHFVTAKINSWIGSGTHGPAGSDTAGTTITVDNMSPGNVTGTSGAAGNAQVVLDWANPADTDLGSIVVLRSTAAVTDTPAEGTTYSVGNTLVPAGNTVACVVAAPATTCTDTGLTNGTAYHYRIFTQDSNGNYSNAGTVPTGSPFTPTLGRFAVATGNWSNTNTWSSTGCGGAAPATVPVTGNDVTICNGFIVTIDTNTASLGSLTVESGGTLRFGTATARTLTVTGNITNAGTLDVNTASNPTHSLVIGGNIDNTGIFNLAPDADSECNTTFNKNGSQTVSGAGATTRFNLIALDMGTTNANILEIATGVNFSTRGAGFLSWTTATSGGTFKYSAAANITPFTANPTISAARGFWLNSSATVSSGNFDWTVTGSSDTARGLVRVSSGTLNLGTAGGNDLIAGNFSDIEFLGGTINIGGALTRAAPADNVRFNMSAGTLTVGAVGAPGNYSFRLGTGASFTMSGGTIVVRRDSGGNGYENLAGTTSVTGGTLQIGDGSSPANEVMGINSTAPIGNLLINNATATGDLQAALTVNGNVTITAGTLDANTFGLTLGGNWSLTDTFIPGTGTVTFNGSTAQTITGVTTFNNLVIANASGVTANNNLTMNGNFTINASAVFNAGSVTHDVNGDFTNNGTFNADTSSVLFSGTAIQTLAGATTFYGLTFNNAAGFTLSNDMTASNALTLTSGIIATGVANTLIFSSTTSCSVARTTGHVNGNLRKNFVTTTLTNCQFEIGDSANYLPVTVVFGNVTSNGNLTVSTTDSDHPNINTSGIDPNDNINRYWTLTRGGGLLFDSYTVTLNYVSPGDYDVTFPTTTAPDTAQRFKSSSWSNLSFFGSPTTTQAVLSGVTDDGDFALGKSSVAGVEREKEFIYTRELFY